MPMVCGIDEAGRGPLAGPVVTAAVMLTDGFPTERLADSKRISEAERYELEAVIREKAARWGTSCAWPDEIDRLNIHWATLLAMQRAFSAMMGLPDEAFGEAPREMDVGPAPAELDRRELTEGGGLEVVPTGGRVFVDGRFTPELPWPAEAVVGGDGIVPEIMAASILAKTSRDRWMIAYAERAPGYGFERHKGYPTPSHRRAISALGPSPIHRLSFRLTPSESASPPG